MLCRERNALDSAVGVTVVKLSSLKNSFLKGSKLVRLPLFRRIVFFLFHIIFYFSKQDVPCSSVAEFHIGYNASCAQNHIKKLVKAIDHKGKVIETERLIPSNCYCKVKQQERVNHKYVESLLIKKDDRSENPENV